jgi:hypothetical protein
MTHNSYLDQAWARRELPLGEFHDEEIGGFDQYAGVCVSGAAFVVSYIVRDGLEREAL